MSEYDALPLEDLTNIRAYKNDILADRRQLLMDQLEEDKQGELESTVNRLTNLQTNKIDPLLTKIRNKKDDETVSLSDETIREDIRRHLGLRDKRKMRKYLRRYEKLVQHQADVEAKYNNIVALQLKDLTTDIAVLDQLINIHNILIDPQKYFKEKLNFIVAQAEAGNIDDVQLNIELEKIEQTVLELQAFGVDKNIANKIMGSLDPIKGIPAMNDYFMEDINQQMQIFEQTRQTNNPAYLALKVDKEKREKQNEIAPIILDKMTPIFQELIDSAPEPVLESESSIESELIESSQASLPTEVAELSDDLQSLVEGEAIRLKAPADMKQEEPLAQEDPGDQQKPKGKVRTLIEHYNRLEEQSRQGAENTKGTPTAPGSKKRRPRT